MGFDTYANFVLALVFVLALIALVAWAYRRFMTGGQMLGGLRGPGRIQVVEVRPIDTRRRAVLIRRDDREHLILLSPTSETVIETGIPADGAPRQ